MSRDEKKMHVSDGLEVHEAAATGDADSLVEYLRTNKYDVNLRDADWNDRAALHWAALRGFVECIRILLEHGADGMIRTDSGWTPAHCAGETGKLTVLRALHNAGVPLDLTDKYGDTPRDIAAIYGHHDCVQFLNHLAQEKEKEDCQT
ncbi:ankyrin repeat domain-containing protein 66-like isoform X1 [Mizuhopecten yessoensis]|uniref:Ankyrin repeat domain-containing protein 66 n=2 Tax=Mizuhopecten yessoensis TaxID=6573 RepID=A0A210R5P0_MIZYE|nr:ankyrin repeat domain-containing protein 66-like isoform X1 [Mizuhopecten yessoensis]OWF56332.1 Ankyrin repeat domain-containing protein 66 [Mizuhopecten yessoensis]